MTGLLETVAALGMGPDDDLSSSYPPWEDAMNHRYPGSYGSRTGG